MTVSVVIPARNESRTIRQLLDAVVGQTRCPDEIVVADDASTDDTAKLVEQFGRPVSACRIRLIPGRGRGVAAALNTAITACVGDVVVRLDGHSRPEKDYIERSLDRLRNDRVAVVGGVWQIEAGDSSLTARVIARVVSHASVSGGAQYRSPARLGLEPVHVDTVPFGVFRRELWRQLGGFDEGLLANEDFDFNYRARVAGAQVVLDPNIRSTYFARPTLGALARQYRHYGFWKFAMLRKDFRALRWRQVPPALILPWVLLSSTAALMSTGTVTVLAASIYPVAVTVAATHVGWTMRSVVAWPMAALAIAVAHLSWSAGFLAALFRRQPPS